VTAAVSRVVVVVGSVNVDMVFRVPRLPGPGETVTRGSFTRSPGGKGGNQAVAAARLGARTWFLGLLGDDELGVEARRDLESAGVDVSLVRTGAAHTGVAGIFVDEGGENMIAVASGANSELDGPRVQEAFAGLDVEGAVVLANLEIPDEAVIAAATVAGERGWPFVLNPAPAREIPGDVLARCSVLVPNEVEMEDLGGGSVDDLLEAGVGAVVVTRGRQGADLHRRGRPAHRQQSFPGEVVDTTGAGDAFCGALGWALAGGTDLEEAVRLAAAAGALACRDVGARAGLPHRSEIERLASQASA
jgi:ribokinase